MLSLPIAQRPKRASCASAWVVRLGVAVLLATLLAVPAWSQDDEDEEPGEFAQYASRVQNRFLMGVNSLITWPADPVMGAVDPREEFDELPVAVVSKRIVGLLQGTLLGAYRAGTGALDVVFAPITPMRMLSAEPRYQLFESEGVEHEWY